MIKRVKICDFKSIRDLDLKLDDVTVLVGRSGTGKSNVVRAIRFVRNLLRDFQEAVKCESGWQHIVPVGEPNPRTSFELFFAIPGDDAEYSYRLTFSVPGANQPFTEQLHLSEEGLKLGDQEIFSRVRQAQDWEWKTKPNVSPVPKPDSPYPLLGQFPSLQQVVFANAALSAGIGYYHFPASTLARGRIDPHEQNLLRDMPGLTDTGDNYLKVIRGITQDFHHPSIRKNILASLREVNPAIESIELDSLSDPKGAIIGHRAANSIFALPLDQESDGLRRFYAHLLALYQTPAKLTLVFEEPENAIFPGALSVLADEFKAAPRENRGQVILTTHNPVLLDSFEPENVRAVELRDGKTLVGPIATDQSRAIKDHLLTTGELLTTDRARLDEAATTQAT